LSAKRGGKVARPTASSEWAIRAGNRAAGRAWAELSNGKMANALARLYDILTKNPRQLSSPGRHHQLKGDLATADYGGRTLERWQHEISGGGRVWFLIDDEEQTVWLVAVGEGHPTATD
jgi:hypothetical protein